MRVAATGEAFFRYEKRGPVAYVTITRPEVMNALNPAAHHELGAVWGDFERDPNPAVGVGHGCGIGLGIAPAIEIRQRIGSR